MKVLLDENLPHERRLLLAPTHEVFTVAYLDWAALQNGDLLAQAAAAGFDAMVTKDQEIEYEQNMAGLPVAVVVLRAKTNRIEDIRPLVPELLATLLSLNPRSLAKVG